MNYQLSTEPLSYPLWVYDLVGALADHENEHAAVGDGGHCFKSELDQVPGEVIVQATAITAYNRARRLQTYQADQAAARAGEVYTGACAGS
ncbi:hypothetical protein ACIBG8_54435 [Nonomuraea sp. NPDC050556]|uniref:hypothetical protein n=1 Tax=Nonomuraea sp. NPDC050556 TaxID=3364369 RepID=UPI0037A8228A